MAFIRCILGFLLFLLGLPGADGQTFRYRDYQHDSLPFGAVHHIHRDPGKRIWLGTDNGLYQYDGHNFIGFNTQLKSRTIRGFLQWSADSLLMLNDRGVYRIAADQSGPKLSPFLMADSLRYPTGMYREAMGPLWVSYAGGQLARYRPGSGELTTYHPDGAEGASGSRWLQDPEGRIWVALLGRGVYRHDPENKLWVRVLQGPVRDLTVNEGTLYALFEDGTASRLRISEQGGAWKTMELAEPLHHLYPLAPGQFLVAGEKGIYNARLGDARISLQPVFGSNDPHRIEALPFRDIHSLTPEWEEGQLQRIWVATGRGFGLLWKGFFESVPGLPHDNVLSLNTVGTSGVWVSMGQLYEVGETGFDVFEFPEAISGISVSGSVVVLGGNAGGLSGYRNGSEVWKRDLGTRGGGIFYLFTDSDSQLWFCQAPSERPLPGVARTDTAGRIRYYGPEDGLDSRILVVGEGGRQELYAAGIGTRTYLYKYDRAADRFVNRSLPLPFEPSVNFEVHDLAVDESGLVWLATTDGLLLFDGEFIRRVALGRYTTFEIRSVGVDRSGAVWAATDTDGLLYLDADRNPPVRFGEANGLPSKISSYRALDFDREGRLWLGTAEGLVHSGAMDPRPRTSPQPELFAGNNVIGPNLEVFRGEARDVRVATYAYPGDFLTYQYRRTPVEYSAAERSLQPWLPLERRQLSIELENPGQYRYEVRAKQGEGYSWSEPTVLEVVVRTPWYRHRVLYATLLLLGIVGIWMGWRRSMKRRLSGLQQELERQNTTLVEQTDALKAREESARATQTHMYLLERLVRQLPQQLTWKDIWPVFRRVLALPLDIERLEIFARSGQEIHSRSIHRGDEVPRHRSQPFDEKANLPSYVLSNRRFVHLTDLSDPGQWPVARNSERSGSLLLIPFEQAGAGYVFGAYSPRKEAFSQDDQIILKLFVSILSRSLTDAFE